MDDQQRGIIKRARQRIADEVAYTVEGYAYRADGTACTPKDVLATQWCPEGAIYASDEVPEREAAVTQGGLMETKFRSVTGYDCIRLIEEFVRDRRTEAKEQPAHGMFSFVSHCISLIKAFIAGKHAEVEERPAHVMLRFVAKDLSHADMLKLFDDVLAEA